MKKLLLPILPLMGLGFSAFAQSHINIELLSATYTAPAVQFRVSWDAIPEGACHNSKIWLWVDFRKIENNQPSGSWARATVDNPSPGTVAPETTKGFWLQGNSGSYSQIVTVALTNIPANTKFNWCAYASDCPPFVIANNGTYTLQGTSPFILKATDGTSLTVEGNTLPASSLTIAAVTLTDKTECPSFFCAYTGSDLLRDETHLCGHRTTGAQNWEAWIKDTRDDEIYRIVMMPDNNWWLAQNLNYNYTGTMCPLNSTAECNKCGRMWHVTDAVPSNICPNGWQVPTVNRIITIAPSDITINVIKSTTGWLGVAGCSQGPGSDYFGFTLLPCGFRDHLNGTTTMKGVGNASYLALSELNWRLQTGTQNEHNCAMWRTIDQDNDWGFIRCFRQL
jgi:uncharacterized protein (TIGR02145 family)